MNYSTISLNVQEVGEYTEQQAVTISYGQRLLNAFTDSLKGAGRFFKNLLVFLVSALPTLVIPRGAVLRAAPAFRKLSAKAKARREEKKEHRGKNKNKAE